MRVLGLILAQYTRCGVLLIARSFLFFYKATAAPEIYTLSLHDALPISHGRRPRAAVEREQDRPPRRVVDVGARSEEHTSELQSPDHLVCRLLLEKKNNLLTDLSRMIASRAMTVGCDTRCRTNHCPTRRD